MVFATGSIMKMETLKKYFYFYFFFLLKINLKMVLAIQATCIAQQYNIR